MQSIRLTCSEHGSFETTREDVRVFVRTSDEYGWFDFTCREGEKPHVESREKTVQQGTITLLMASGVEIITIDDTGMHDDANAMSPMSGGVFLKHIEGFQTTDERIAYAFDHELSENPPM